MFRPALALSAFALSLAACSPAGDEAAPAADMSAPAVESSSAPSVGGRTELPKGEGVTPEPEALEGATAKEVQAPLSPDQAARASGGSQGASGREEGGKLNPSGSNPG